MDYLYDFWIVFILILIAVIVLQNFDSWKSKRKSCLPVSDRDSDEHDDTKESAGGNLKTFPAMIAERLQRQGGALASYLDDSLGGELRITVQI